MQTFIVPTTFTASDKYSKTLDYMGTRTRTFASGLHSTATASENLFRRLTPGISEASSGFLQMASAAAAVAAAVATIHWSADELMNFEDELANLQAVTGASDEQFSVFKESISKVADETKKSSVVVAQAFTAIANNQPELLKDADALGEVAKQSILLAKAAKIELQPAGEAVTEVLNQYGKGAEYASKLVNILASGSVAGSSEIRDTADAIKAFGTVAATAGVQIDESVALIELGSKFDKGAEAGVKFRNILLNMTGAKVLDKLALKDLKKAGVNLDIVSSKTLPLNTRLLEMSKIAKDTNAIMHVFGKENAAMAAGVLNNAGSFAKMQEQVNQTGEAERMAAKNSDTLRNRIDEVKASFITYLTSSESLNTVLNYTKDAMVFVARNIDPIIKGGLAVVGVMAAWKAVNIGLKLSTMALSAVNTAFYLVDMVKYVAATQGITKATAAWEIIQASLNVTMMANPIFLLIGAAAALAGGIWALTKRHEQLNEEYRQGILLRQQSAMEKEQKEVNDLVVSYRLLGKNINEANVAAIKFRYQQISLQRMDAENKITSAKKDLKETTITKGGALFGEFTKKHSDAEKSLVENSALAAELAAKKQQLTQLLASSVVSGGISKSDAIGIVNQPVSAVNSKTTAQQIESNRISQLGALEMKGGYKPAVSTKVAQTESVINSNKTNKTEATLKIINDSDYRAFYESENKSAGMLPKTTSTVQMTPKP